MTPYWVLFLILAVPALVSTNPAKPKRAAVVWLLLGIVLALFIGLRHEVGGDWGNYIARFNSFRWMDLLAVLKESDPGYAYLNWQMNQWGFGIYAVNLVCAALFTFGVTVFARRQPFPWLVLTVAFPYLIMVVAMGYTRQGVAIGFILLALTMLEGRKFFPYLVFITMATLFHRTALVMIPLGLFLFGRGWAVRAVTIFMTAIVLYDALVAKETEQLWQTYVDQERQSQGARIRVLMNLVPSLLLLWFWKDWRNRFPDYWFWFWIALGSVVSVFLVGIASTAVDRIALYFLPIQLVVFSRLPLLLGRKIDPVLIKTGIIMGYSAVLFVWLNYAVNAFAWLPYQNLLFL